MKMRNLIQIIIFLNLIFLPFVARANWYIEHYGPGTCIPLNWFLPNINTPNQLLHYLRNSGTLNHRTTIRLRDVRNGEVVMITRTPRSCPMAWCRSGSLSSFGCVVRLPVLAG